MPFLSALTTITPPAQLPLDVNFARRYARINQCYDNDLLSVFIATATDLIERFLDRALITQTLQYSLVRTTNLNSWPLAPAPLFILPMGVEWILQHMQERDIGLLRNPVQSVISVATGCWGNADTTLVLNTDYNVDLTVDPGRIHLINGDNWEQRDHIIIQYTAGYGNDYTAIPAAIVQGLLLLTKNLYENRDNEEIPEAVYNLIWPYRLVSFGES